MVWPFAERSSSVKVAVVAESCVWHEPLLIIGKEALEVGLLCECSLFLCEYLTQVFHLRFVHSFIVYLRQGIKFFLQCGIMFATSFVFQFRELSQVSILWMECIDAYAVVWIGVGPGMGDVCVVDGQNLQHTLFSVCHPVNHHLQVSEVAHAETAFRP